MGNSKKSKHKATVFVCRKINIINFYKIKIFYNKINIKLFYIK